MHSHNRPDTYRGLELIEALLSTDGAERRELLYLRAVAQFRLKQHIACRTTLKTILEEYPEFRQADSLLDSCEHEIVKDGLVGVGAGAAILGIVAGIAVAAMRR